MTSDRQGFDRSATITRSILGYGMLAGPFYLVVGVVQGERALARYSLFSGLAVLLGFFGGFFIPGIAGGTFGIWFAVIIGCIWLAVLSRHLYRVSPDPHCAPTSELT